MINVKEFLSRTNANTLVIIGNSEPMKAVKIFHDDTSCLEYEILKSDCIIIDYKGKKVPVIKLYVEKPYPFEDDVEYRCIKMFSALKNLYGQYLGTQVAYEKCHELLESVSHLLSPQKQLYLCEQIDIITFR